ncbi:uncharacterized protein M8220_011048 isoform 2-T9 [Acridotheres tristis]
MAKLFCLAEVDISQPPPADHEFQKTPVGADRWQGLPLSPMMWIPEPTEELLEVIQHNVGKMTGTKKQFRALLGTLFFGTLVSLWVNINGRRKGSRLCLCCQRCKRSEFLSA